MLRGILFDMFGTLVDYNPIRTEQGFHATHALLRAHGIEVSYETFLECCRAVPERLTCRAPHRDYDTIA